MMIHRHLAERLERVSQRLTRMKTLRWLAVSWLVLALLALLGSAFVRSGGPGQMAFIAAFLFIAGTTTMLVRAFAQRRRNDLRHAARAVEQIFPELNDRLLAASEQQPSLQTGRLRVLQRQVIQEALAHSELNEWKAVVPQRRMAGAYCLNAFGLFALLGALGALFTATPARMHDSSNVVRRIDIPGPGTEYGLTVEPGSTSVERGTSLLVLARFAKALPGDVTLVVRPKTPDAEGQAGERRIPLAKSLDDPVFGGRISRVDDDLTYHVAYDALRSEEFTVAVFDYPQVERIDAVIQFPDYSGLEHTVVEDTRQVTVVEGSSVTLRCYMNKPVASARIRHGEEPAADLSAHDGESLVFETTLTPDASRDYDIELTDNEGRANKLPETFRIDVAPNRRPDLKLAFPAKDLRVSPLEEVALEATAWDDFGLQQYGVIYSVAEQSPQTIVLGETTPAKSEAEMRHLLSFEALDARPDQLVSYYFFADDVGPDGRTRRTFSDMYFAEVRHFEEIFREGPQMPGGQSQQGGGRNAQQAEQLANLQKEIINATWKLIRRETRDRPSDEFGGDVRLIRENQEAAAKQVAELQEKVSDAKSKALVDEVLRHMAEAVVELRQSAEENETAPLQPALASEQAAYQALLKLRAREHRVVQSQSGGGGGQGGGQRSQQQLQQLELSNEQNRYETQRNASQQPSQANQEQLQVLNRLRELARRQRDLNQKLKELENALREAKTREEQEEIERRLKRLREQQQEMLRDLDELRNHMDRPENQAEMADSREQLDQTRERVLRASEELERGRVSQALSAGTRAERELDQLRDEFRKQTAGQFAEAMEDLRSQARELERRENELAENLRDYQSDQPGSLRRTQDREDIAEGFRQQKDQLNQILEQMRNIIRQAEPSEPLLAQQLYDTVRNSRRHKPAEALDMTAELTERGLVPHAEEAEKQARRGIEEIKSGIESAAESVLGNELESLRRARSDLAELSDRVRDELAQADPQQRRGEGISDSESQDPDSAGRPGDGERRQQDSQSDASQQGSQQSDEGRATESDESARADRQARRRSSSQSSDRSSQPPGREPSDDAPNSQPTENHSNRQESTETEDDARQQSSGSSPSEESQDSESSNAANRSSQQSSQSQQSSRSQSSGSAGSRESSSQQSGRPGGQSEGNASQSSQRGRPGLRPGNRRQQSQGAARGRELPFFNHGGHSGGPGGPLTGEDYQEWSDGLRNVEEMVDDPQLRAEVARVRERARSMRVEFKRHSKEPAWDLVRTEIYEPLVELQNRLAEEIARRESDDALVPIDRDPVPDRYSELVRRYYENLGSGK